jgi:hypothetical protein
MNDEITEVDAKGVEPFREALLRVLADVGRGFAEAGVNEAVGDVEEEIDGNEEEAEAEDEGDGEVVVLAGDGLEEGEAEAWPAEEELDDGEAAEGEAEGGADGGEDGDGGVADDVA